MRKLGVFLFGAFLCVGGAFCLNQDVVTANADIKEVCVGGMPAGFTLSAGGIQVLGFCDVTTENRKYSPAIEAGLRAGDLVIEAKGIKVETISQFNEILAKNRDNPLSCKIMRGEETLEITLYPVKDKASDRFKIGVLIRDGISGIGTVTYIDKESGKFGALGHAVVGANEKHLSLVDGEVYSCNIIGVSKGVRGKAGELRGMFLAEKSIGKAEKLCTCGIYGKIRGDFDTKQLKLVKASSANVKPGKATIYSTVSGESPKEYEIEIVKVDKTQKENKNYVIKIVDERLLEETGGIVQGMSGSPILQNDQMVGAVTHVFVNDPTRGFGILIDHMLGQ